MEEASPLLLSVTCHEGLNRLSDFRENQYRHLLQNKSSSQHDFHYSWLAEILTFLTGGDAFLSVILTFIERFP